MKVLTKQGVQTDTELPPYSKLAFGVFAALVEFERELIVERTKAGLAASRARKHMDGKPKKLTSLTLKMAVFQYHLV